VYYGRGRDIYDVCGRVAHESLFNPLSGTYRGPNSQQGYSPFTTWTRGLAWAMLGFAEQIEFLESIGAIAGGQGHPDTSIDFMIEAARATCDFTSRSRAPMACRSGTPARPASQMLWRLGVAPPIRSTTSAGRQFGGLPSRRRGAAPLGRWLSQRGGDGGRHAGRSHRARHALRCERSVPSASADHQGLMLHSVYHRPNGWDHVPAGARTPRGESSMGRYPRAKRRCKSSGCAAVPT
jgi:hypothetical protein